MQAASSIVDVSLGMSNHFKNSGSLSRVRHSLMVENSRAPNIDSFACFLQRQRNGGLRTSGWYTVASVQHQGRLSHLLINLVSLHWSAARAFSDIRSTISRK